jgi:phospholipid/cholesterol/gamma-HCH transport system substrate-binding protein
MDDRVIQFRLGVFVVLVATMVMMLALIFLFGELPQGRQKIIYVRFDNTPGVTVETPVRKSGILIGRVRKEPLLVENGVVLTVSVDPKQKLFASDVCRISSDNIFGDAVLEFVAGPRGGASREVQDGDYLNGIVANNPLDALRVVVDLESELNLALSSIRAAGEEVGGVAESLNVLVANNQDQFNRILGKTERALGRFDTAMTAISQVVSDDDLNLSITEALEGVPRLFNDAGKLLQGLNRVTDEAERNLLNLRGLTEPLGKQGGLIVDNLNRSAGRLDDLLSEFQTFGQKLNSNDGTVGNLVNNPELYQNLNRAAENIEEMSRQLRPIVADARVAIDKVARNPRMLGVQGALDRRSSGIK